MQEREKRERGRKEQERERGAGPGRQKRKRKKREMSWCTPDLPSSVEAVLPCKQEKGGTKTRAGPKRRKGEEEGGRGEKKNRKPRPQSPEKRRKKNSLTLTSKSIQKRPEPTKTHPTQNSEFVAQNPPQKRAVTKIELRK